MWPLNIVYQLMQHGPNQVLIRKEAAVTLVRSKPDLDFRCPATAAIDIETLWKRSCEVSWLSAAAGTCVACSTACKAKQLAQATRRKPVNSQQVSASVNATHQQVWVLGRELR